MVEAPKTLCATAPSSTVVAAVAVGDDAVVVAAGAGHHTMLAVVVPSDWHMQEDNCILVAPRLVLEHALSSALTQVAVVDMLASCVVAAAAAAVEVAVDILFVDIGAVLLEDVAKVEPVGGAGGPRRAVA